ncbi:MAG: serine/threonine-protein kinase, partial [Acidobacteriota bacterium]
MEKDNENNLATTTAEPINSGNYLGLVLKDRYLIERELGRGGLGAVFLARDKQLLNRAVVIKVLVAESGNEKYHDWFQKKFKQEMEALSRINHPSVVGVLDTGEMPDGKPFLVMQYVDGRMLRAFMTTSGMEFGRVANIVRQMGQALTAAHEKGVFHRDLKPENIMLEDLGRGQEQVKLIDFGVARIKDSQVASDAVNTWIAGTPPYMAPEQLRGKPIAESDIYGLGAVVYEMLTGQQAFKIESAVDLYELQRDGVITPPKALRADLPAAANAAILKALSFNIKDRYKSARDFADDLAAALTGQASPLGVQTPTLSPGFTTVVAAMLPTAPDRTQLLDTPKAAEPRDVIEPVILKPRTSLKRVAGIAALVVSLALGAWFLPKAFRTAPVVTPAPNVALEPVFSYWVMVQKYRDGKPYQSPFRLAGEINFENDYHIRLHVRGEREGFLYIINEAPEPVNGLPEYVILFPSPTANQGSAQLARDQQLAIPEIGDGFFFLQDQGTEKLWLVWSKKTLPELE